MIVVQIYQSVYLISVLILTIITINQYYQTNRYIGEGKGSPTSVTLFVALSMMLFIGLRPVSGVFVDMVNYNASYNALYYGSPFSFSWSLDNFLFDNLFAWMGSMMFDISWFFLIIAAIYFGGIAWASKKMFPNDTLLAFVMYLGAFSTFSYSTNGIKAGAAASIFLVALAYKDNLKVCIPLLWVTLGFHHSMLAPIVAFVIAYFVRKPKWYLYGWLFCLLLAVAHIVYFLSLFSGFTDEHGAGYLVADRKDAEVSGFRPDFILYSAIPIFIGYYLITKRYIQSEYYNFLWCTYTLTNCVFLLCTYGSFINRIAYLSWLMYPFILLYPFVNAYWSNRQSRYLRYVVYGHLGFTLFMDFIYYA